MVDDPEIEPLEGGDDDVEEEPAEIDGDTDGDAVPTERPDPSPKSDPVPLPDEPVPTETPGQP